MSNISDDIIDQIEKDLENVILNDIKWTFAGLLITIFILLLVMCGAFK